MKDFKVAMPPLARRKKFVARIEVMEMQITDAQIVADSASVPKQGFLPKYL